MKNTATTPNFKNQNVYVGIDVHKNQYTYCIRVSGVENEVKVIDSKAELLIRMLKSNYPEANFYSVYEAGFSGYGLHRKLTEAGIKNLVVHPGDIPASSRERSSKTDRVDARKLARELEKDNLRSIYIPSKEEEGFRAMIRVRSNIVRMKAKIMVEIKSLLNYMQDQLPAMIEMPRWSGRFITYLKQLDVKNNGVRIALDAMLNILQLYRQQLLELLKNIRQYISEREELRHQVVLLQSIPGIGFITAVHFIGELMRMDRFRGFGQVASYIGLIPCAYSSGDREHILGISRRHHPVLRNLLIESAWVAVQKDRALMAVYSRLIGRMKKQMAIIRIAKKLLSRIRYVLISGKPYQYHLVEERAEKLPLKKMVLKGRKNSKLVLNP